MNEPDPIDVDRWGHAAAADVRSRAALVADTDRAWFNLIGHLDLDGVHVEYDRDPFDRRPVAHERRRFVAAAASLLIALGMAAAFVAVRTEPLVPPSANSTTSSRYLLPTSESGYCIVPGSFTGSSDDVTDASAGDVRSVTVVGVPAAGGWYGSLMQIIVRTTSPSATADEGPGGGETWQAIDTPSGPAITSRFGEVWVAVAQQRGDRWLQVASAPADRDAAVGLLSQVSIEYDGSVGVDARSGFVPLESVELGGSASATPVASYSVSGPGIDPAGDENVFVEIAEAPQVLLGVPGAAEAVRSVIINGHPGWEAKRDDGDAAWSAYAWRVTDGTIVAVSGHFPAEIVRAVAESLVSVDEASWRQTTDADEPS